MEMTKLRLSRSRTLEQITVCLHRAQNALSRLGKNITDRHRQIREALRAREYELQVLLASSGDAVAVVNGDHCFVAANAKARELFGISETNIRKFNIDAFLRPNQIPDFDRNVSTFIRRNEKRGACEIHRLDGSVCVAEHILAANFLPLRHVCRFRNIVAVQSDLSRSPSLMAEIAFRRISSAGEPASTNEPRRSLRSR